MESGGVGVAVTTRSGAQDGQGGMIASDTHCGQRIQDTRFVNGLWVCFAGLHVCDLFECMF